MRTFHDAKAMAKALRAELARREIAVGHSEALEIVARQFGFDNWNVLAARIRAAEGGVRLAAAVPVLRIFSLAKAREFYLDFLGFTVDWEHRFAPDSPVYLQVSRSGMTLHLSEHHGDGSPGTTVYIPMSGIVEFHAELTAKRYPYARPGIEDEPWQARSVTVTDPFGNTLRFNEPNATENDGSREVVSREIVVAAAVERVWEFVTRAEHIRKWYAFDGASVDLRPGGVIEHFWAEHGRYRGVVEAVDAPTRLVYRYSTVEGADPAPGRQTTVEFRLEPLPDGTTRVTVTEAGFAELELSPEERQAHIDETRQGWHGGLDGLAALADRYSD